MNLLIAFMFGFSLGVLGTTLIARNNREKFNKALDIDPKAKWDEVVDNLKDRIK